MDKCPYDLSAQHVLVSIKRRERNPMNGQIFNLQFELNLNSFLLVYLV